MLAYARYDNSGSLPFGFRHHDISHNGRIGVVKVADRFIGQLKVEGLYQSAYHGHALLLSKTHTSNFGIKFVGDT